MNIIATEKAPGAIGPYSQGYEVNGMVFTSGQIPVDPATGNIPEGIAAQAEQSCKNVGKLLKRHVSWQRLLTLRHSMKYMQNILYLNRQEAAWQ